MGYSGEDGGGIVRLIDCFSSAFGDTRNKWAFMKMWKPIYFINFCKPTLTPTCCTFISPMPVPSSGNW